MCRRLLMARLLAVWRTCLRFENRLVNRSPWVSALTSSSTELHQQSPPEERLRKSQPLAIPAVSSRNGSQSHNHITDEKSGAVTLDVTNGGRRACAEPFRGEQPMTNEDNDRDERNPAIENATSRRTVMEAAGVGAGIILMSGTVSAYEVETGDTPPRLSIGGTNS